MAERNRNVYKFKMLNLIVKKQIVDKDIELVEESSSFISHNMPLLEEQFPNRFIAVKGSTIVENDQNFERLVERIEDKKILLNQSS